MLKNRKKVVLITTILSMSLIVPVYADGIAANQRGEPPIKMIALQEQKASMISKEKAVAIAKKALKEYLDISVEDKEYQLNIENRRDWEYGERYVWSICWNYQDAVEYANASVVLDASTAEILDMNGDSVRYGQQNKKTIVLTKEEAQTKAEDFIKKILPQRWEQVQLEENDSKDPVFYYFNYRGIHDGIKVSGNEIKVTIDGSTGKIRNFSYRWNDEKGFPSREGIKTLEDANKILREKTTLELIYQPIRNEFKYEEVPQNIKLAYRLGNDLGNGIDAKTGKRIGWNGKEEEEVQLTADITDEQVKNILKNAKPPVERTQEISKERAQEVALSVLKEAIGRPVKINTINYIEGGQYWETAGKKAWNIEFSVEKNEQDKNTIASVQNGRLMLDALTEEVVAFNLWHSYKPDEESFKPAMTWEEAYKKAIDVIAKYHPDKIDQIQTMQTSRPSSEIVYGKEVSPREYSFTFSRKIHNACYDDNCIRISFDNQTGALQDFLCRWNEEIIFPSQEGVLSIEKAKDIFFYYYQPELMYGRFLSNPEEVANREEGPNYETKLIYRLIPKSPQVETYRLMDALSGKLIDYKGRPLSIDEDHAFDRQIKDHWIERYARILGDQDILDKTTFKPDHTITKLEAVKMLVKAKGIDRYNLAKEEVDAGSKVKFSDIPEDSDDYRYIQMAIRYGMIDNQEGLFNGKAVISREELAVMIVRMLGYDELAKAKDIFILSFIDKNQITPDRVGYIAICKGLGIIGENGSFRPKDQATMAEMAMMVYRSLDKLQR
jgi:hypothetical protein